MTDLYLPIKREYFDEILNGHKVEEFRLVTPYWKRRLEGREYQTIIITMGYPKRSDTSKKLRFKYKGYRVATIEHPHFGPEPVMVFAIDLSEPLR